MSQTLPGSPAEYYASLHKETIACPLCGKNDYQTVFDRDRYQMGLTTVFCPACGFLFTNPRPTQEEIGRFYREHYRRFYTGSHDPEKDYQKHSVVSQRAGRLFSLLEAEWKDRKRPPVILDAGCGSGAFLYCARKTWPNAMLYGLEPDEPFARHAKEMTQASVLPLDIDAFLNLENRFEKSYDVLILNHVLEHLYQPISKLARLAENLQENGLLLIEVPDWRSPHWVQPVEMLHLAHTSHFSRQTLEWTLQAAGFELIRFSKEKLSRSNPWVLTLLARKNTAVQTKTFTPITVQESQDLLEELKALGSRMERQDHIEIFLRIIVKKSLYESLKKISKYHRDHGTKETAEKSLRFFSGLLSRHFEPFLQQLGRTWSLHWQNRRQSNRRVILSNEIKGRRVLILGSGPSASELKSIPGDVLIFTCNRGIRRLAAIQPSRTPDIYLTTKSKIKRFPIVETLLDRLGSGILLVDNIRFAHNHPSLQKTCRQILYDDGMDDHLLNQLMDKNVARRLRGHSHHPWTSTGIRLLQYALVYGAKEIYLAGIDFGEQGYFWGKNEDPWFHHDIDENFIDWTSKTYDNVYSISAKSRLANYLPVKLID